MNTNDTTQGGIFNYFYGSIGSVQYNNYGTKTEPAQTGANEQDAKDEKIQLSDEKLTRAIEASQGEFWGNVSYAVLFCIIRDDYKTIPSRPKFESLMQNLPFRKNLSYSCTDGTLDNAFRNNQWLKESIDDWDKILPPKDKALVLRDKLREELNK